MDHKSTDWLSVVRDAFWVFVVFGVWLWQFEASADGSVYHSILAAVGFIAGIGICLLLAATLLAVFTSQRDSDSR